MHGKVKIMVNVKFLFGFHTFNLHNSTLGHTDRIYAPRLCNVVCQSTNHEKAHTS